MSKELDKAIEDFNGRKETANRKTAVKKFIEVSNQNVDLLNKLSSYINNFHDEMPEDINWANVGDASYINAGLKDLVRFIGFGD